MLRGYRGILIAAFGWLSLSASNGQTPEQRARREQAKTPSQIAEAGAQIERAIIRTISKEDQGCDKGKDARESDLCAQWKAADAATDGAYWSKWSFWLALVGTCGVIVSLYYTRKAVLAAEDATKDADAALEIANRSAKAAEQQAIIAQSTAKQQLRAYLGVANANISNLAPGAVPRFMIELVNSGRTPAHSVGFSINFGLHERIEDFRRNLPPHDAAEMVINPGANQTLSKDIEVIISRETYAEIASGQRFLIVYGIVSYLDIFGERHQTDFCYRFNHYAMDGAGFREPHGNSAT